MNKTFKVNLAAPIIYLVWIIGMIKTFHTPVFWVLLYLFIKELKLTLEWEWK